MMDRGRYPYFVTCYLALIYMFNFMDRQLVSILQEPIRAEMNLSDAQLGLVSGLGFALFYTVCGLPVARLCDRYRRVSIMAAACAIWSLFTVACGYAQSFVQLVLARMMVGVGEAGGAPPSYSLLADYFPPERRAGAFGLFALGVPLGAAAGTALGGWIAAHHGWRAAFIVIGAPGVLLALILLFVVREPVRGGTDPGGARRNDTPMPSIARAMIAFFADPTLRLTALAGGMSAFVGYAMLNWNPSLLARAKGMSLTEIATYYSIVLGIGGVIGIFGAGWLVDRLAVRDVRWYAWIPALAFALSLPGHIGLILVESWPLALVCVAMPALLHKTYLAPALAIVHNRSPAEGRTLAGATLLFVVNILGLGGGPLFMGWISDLARPMLGERSLIAAYIALIPMIVITICLHLAVARAMVRDRHRHTGILPVGGTA
jgi:MFS family permease